MEVTHNARNGSDDDGFSVLCFFLPGLALVLPCRPRRDGNQALLEGHEKKVRKGVDNNPFPCYNSINEREQTRRKTP